MDSPDPINSPDPGADDPLITAFVGRRGRVFRLALGTGVLTVLTLGIYRFWMKTRLRRWYWSAIRPGGVPLEYVGDPLEKLLGFLIAVVFLAFYIGIVNLFLMFLSFSLFQGNVAAYLLSFFGVIPLWFYATYRARRYVLARTRWRGVRFGLAPGAWGYAWRALVHWAITLISLGLLWPRMTFWLEKYRTDRTYYGSVRMVQGGRWQMLFPALLHSVFAALTSVGATITALAAGAPQGFFVLALSLPWLGYGLVRYRVRAFQLLTDSKSAGGIGFVARPRTWRVLFIYVFGYGLAGTAIILLVIAGGLGLLFLAAGVVGGLEALAGAQVDDLLADAPGWILTLAGVGLYFSVFLLWSALTHTFVTMPLWRHFAQTLQVVNPGALDQVSQRSRDEHSEAEGFAEALDVGAAI